MAPIDEIRRMNLESLIADAGGLERVAAAADTSSVYLSQIRNQALDRKTGRARQMGTAMARRLETAFGKPIGWMDAPRTAEPPPRLRGGANQIFPLAEASDLPLLTWGDCMADSLPEVFCLTVEDDSMAPRVKRGDVLRFNSGEAARPGDGVLLQDQHGTLYFRVYRERRPGVWEAHPLNEAYQPLDSARDGLRVMAVLTGITDQRWG